jgi:hypothetical protein
MQFIFLTVVSQGKGCIGGDGKLLYTLTYCCVDYAAGPFKIQIKTASLAATLMENILSQMRYQISGKRRQTYYQRHVYVQTTGTFCIQKRTGINSFFPFPYPINNVSYPISIQPNQNSPLLHPSIHPSIHQLQKI